MTINLLKYPLLFFAALSLAFQMRGAEVCKTCSYTTLENALAAVAPHDTIFVKGGTYKLKQAVKIQKPVVLIGVGQPVYDGQEKNGILEIYADSVWVEGFVFQNVGRSYVEDKAALTTDGVYNVTIRNNKFKDTFFAIYCMKTKRGVVENNRIQGNAVDEYSSANAVHLWYCDNMEIRDNHLVNHRDGIYLEFVHNSIIEGNKSAHNLRYGLHFMFSDSNRYVNNEFRDNGAGVAVMFSKYITMTGNLFIENWGTASYGLLLKEIYDSEISNNRFARNTIAIYAEGTNRVMIHHNGFDENGWAMKMLGSSMDNVIEYNNFRGNSFNLATNTSQSKNKFVHNYWDDYAGYDLDRDGVGDVPYHPVNIFTYLVSRIDVSLILMRSTFVELLNLAEKVAPAVTPVAMADEKPLMKPVQ